MSITDSVSNVVIADGGNNTVAIRDAKSGKVATMMSFKSVSPLNALVNAGDKLALAARGFGVFFLNPITLETLNKIDVGGDVYCVSVSPNRRYIAVGLESGEVAVIDTHSITMVSKVQLHSREVNTIAFSPSSSFIVSGSGDNTAVIHTVPDLNKAKTLNGHTKYILTAVYISEDVVATGSFDNTIRIWNVHTEDTMTVISAHTSNVLCLALSPDRTMLVSGGNDNKLCIISTTTFKCTTSVTCANSIFSLCFDGNETVLVGVWNSEVMAVDVRTGAITMTYKKQGCPSIIVMRTQTSLVLVRTRNDALR